MSTIETETDEDTTGTEGDEPALLPATDLDDLFEHEDDDDFEPEVSENLTEEELRVRLVKAEKQANFERTERLKVARKSWATEAQTHFPYSKPDKIKADSRRAFLEAAKEQDTDFRERAAPLLEKVEKTEEQIREEVRAELEGEARSAWGRPTTQSGSSSASAAKEADTDKRLDSARRKRDLTGIASALMDGGRI